METPDITRVTPKYRSEVNHTDFDLLLFSMFEAFQRWQETCFESVAGITLTGQELFVLLAIPYNGRLKTLYEIARILNRTDTFNLKFCTSKLVRLGLIEKVKQPKQKKILFQLTDAGMKCTSKFISLRNRLVTDCLNNETDFNINNMSHIIEKLKSLYDKVTQAAITSK